MGDVILRLSLTKKCTGCKEDKPLDCFYNYKQSKDGKSYRCKACDKLQSIAYRKRHTERDRINRRNQNRKIKYGLTEEDYNKIIKIQNNTCPICLRELTHDWGNQHEATKAVIDHCHTSSIVRGILCTQCNKGIGLLKDDVDYLKRAIDYLEQYTEDKWWNGVTSDVH